MRPAITKDVEKFNLPYDDIGLIYSAMLQKAKEQKRNIVSAADQRADSAMVAFTKDQLDMRPVESGWRRNICTGKKCRS